MTGIDGLFSTGIDGLSVQKAVLANCTWKRRCALVIEAN